MPSGPLLDRIDLHVEVESVPLQDLMATRNRSESSEVIRERVIKARTIQSARFGSVEGICCNARIPEQDLDRYCLLEAAAKKFLFTRMEKLQLSARSYSRIVKVSRTIADLAGVGTVGMEHIAEAIYFRGFDRSVELGRKRIQ